MTLASFKLHIQGLDRSLAVSQVRTDDVFSQPLVGFRTFRA